MHNLFSVLRPRLLMAFGVLALVSGCAHYHPNIPPAPLVTSPSKLTAVGYGSSATYGQYTAGQQKLMAIRAAQVDAYRNLAEQVYGFRVWGNTSVSAFATQNDSVRSYVDAFIRGAKVVNTTAIADGNYEVTVELDLTPRFYGCFNNHQFSCHHYYDHHVSNVPCGGYGCVSPSAAYYSY